MKMKTSRYWDPPHSPVLQSCCCYFLLNMCQQVGSPSPVFPDEMPVHRAEEQSTTLNHLPGASAEPSPTICGYHSIPSEATLSFCFYLSVLLCLVDWRCPPNKVRISQLQRRQSAGGKQPARRPSVQAAPRCTTTGGFRFVPEVWTLTATRGWRFIKLNVLLSLCKFIYLLKTFCSPFSVFPRWSWLRWRFTRRVWNRRRGVCSEKLSGGRPSYPSQRYHRLSITG